MDNDKSWLLRTLTAAALLSAVMLSGSSVAQEPRPQPSDVVRELYREVVKRHPMGVPHGTAKAAIWPFLSKRLIRAFETRDKCDLDWDLRHQNSNPPVKAPGFYEDGLFSGSVEHGYVNGAVVGSSKLQENGSYLVNVKLWSYFDEGEPSLRTGKIYRWQVAARVTSEDGRFAVDDILGFKGSFDYDKPVYMSKMLTTGCSGTHSIAD